MGAGNVLILLLDDIGTDQLSGYGEHPNPPATPVLDGLAGDGVLFRNAYASPLCSPTRAALLTGRHARRTGLGAGVLLLGDTALDPREVLIPEMLQAAPEPWDHAAIGKWHLSGTGSEANLSHPQVSGFRTHKGSLANLNLATIPEAWPGTYEHWERLVDGEPALSTRYATTQTVDDALAEIEQMPEPWLLYVAFNAAHEPVHAPPAELLTAPLDPDASDIDRFAAMVSATDHEIGRLLDGLGPTRRARTTIVALGDNGTPGHLVRAPWDGDRAKLTVYEGGVNIPMIVSGPLVDAPGRESDALVHVVDLFPTVAELAGVQTASLTRDDGTPLVLDGQSLLPLLRDPAAVWARETVVVERFSPSGPPPYRVEQIAVRDAHFKYAELRVFGWVTLGGLYDLRGRWDDGENLLATGEALTDEQQQALERLSARLDAHRSLPYEGG